MAEEESGGGGVGKKCGIACLILLIIMIVGSIVTYYVIKSAALGVAAGVVEGVGEVAVSGASQEDQDAIMGPIKTFAQDIRDGNVSMEQMGRVTENVTEVMEHIGGALRATTFDSKFLQSSELSADEKTAGHMTVTRYAQGKLDEKITGTENSQIGDILMTSEEVTQPDGSTMTKVTYKETLTTDEVKQILEIMKQGADEAGMENKEYTPDMATPLQEAIDKGMEGT